MYSVFCFTDSQNIRTSEALLSKQVDSQELEEDNFHLVTSSISGILKGGLLWRHQGCNLTNDIENSQVRQTLISFSNYSCTRRSFPIRNNITLETGPRCITAPETKSNRL